jgi:hypothetical protein
MKSQSSNNSFNSFFFSLISLFLFLSFSCTQQSPHQTIIHGTTFVNDTTLIYDTLLIPQSQNLTKLPVNSVKVDSFYGEFTGDKMIDGIPAFLNSKETSSRWAVEDYPHYAVFYFSSMVTINKIRFNLYKGDQGFTNHIKIYNFSDLLWEGDIGDSLWNNIYLNFYGSMIYLEVTGPSKNIKGITNDWTDFGEIEFYSYE